MVRVNAATMITTSTVLSIFLTTVLIITRTAGVSGSSLHLIPNS